MPGALLGRCIVKVCAWPGLTLTVITVVAPLTHVARMGEVVFELSVIPLNIHFCGAMPDSEPVVSVAPGGLDETVNWA